MVKLTGCAREPSERADLPEEASLPSLRVAYLVHDLNDPAVARRVRMLRAGGAEVRLTGFHRGADAPSQVADAPARSLGRTRDGRLFSRAASVASAAMQGRERRGAVGGVDIVVARNLEMLLLAAVSLVRSEKPLVYECLDVHRLMLSGAAGTVMRRLERALLGRARLLIVSSPAFLREYFGPKQKHSGPSLLLENKLLDLEGRAAREAVAPPAPPPWRIGWFGAIRCARSLRMLTELAGRLHGRLEVLIAGRPAYDQFDDFDRQVARAPHVRFVGPYLPQDLPALYGDVHFTWAIDYYEEGLNSAWLLPNRLYEGGSQGAVPLALADVETGRWLAERGAGVLLHDPAEELADLFAHLDAPGYAQLRAASAAIPPSDLRATRRDCEDLVRRLRGIA